MDKKKCLQCSERSRETGGIWCNLAHAFIADFNVCLKELTIEQIRESCDNFLPKMDDGDTGCASRLAEGRCFPCWIKKIRDLYDDPHFEFRKEFLAEEGKKARL